MSLPNVPPDLRPYLDEIAERLYSGHAAVMVGAGFSKNALCASQASLQFPAWTQLGDALYKTLHDTEPPSNKRYISIPQLADEVEAAIGRRALDQLLRVAIPDLEFNPSPLHHKLLDLPWVDVFTTNYDTLLERASRSIVTHKYDVVATQDDLVYSKSPRIVKLHGSFPSNRPFIITDEDYRRYPVTFAPFVNTVRQRLIESTLCLIGFSGGDPNFVQWVGWIQDTLGAHGSAKMYLLTIGLSPSESKLLEQRNIVALDMSQYPDIGESDHYEALERFLDYLSYRKTDYDNLTWPIRSISRLRANTSDTDDPSSDTEKLASIVETWRKQRMSYPGWVVLPKDRRDALWMQTEAGYHLFPPTEELPPFLDLHFSFQLVWRLERCLTPLYTHHLPFLETTIERYLRDNDDALPGQEPSSSHEGHRRLSPDAREHQEMCHHLLLSLLRTYREEGRANEWTRISQLIQVHLPRMSPEHRARFYYERAVSALCELNLRNLREQLTRWPTDSTLPFWEAKKAGLLAYIGNNEEAERILDASLQTIRFQTNLKPVTTDYTLPSQEAYIMVLLNYVKQTLRYPDSPRTSNDELQHLTERWQVLKQYKCDPWQELQTFRQALAVPTSKLLESRARPTFDIGHVTTSYEMGRNHESMVAYRYLRFREDSGLPLLMSTKSTASAASRILSSDPYWAAAAFVQTGAYPEVDQVFDRETLARFDTAYVDSLIDRYLNALENATEHGVQTGQAWSNEFATALTKVVPEVVSRLCSKSSDESKYRLLDYLIDLHRSRGKLIYHGVRNLTRRLLTSLSVKQRVTTIPRLLEIATPSELSPFEKDEFVNPFNSLLLDKRWIVEQPVIPSHTIQALIYSAASTAALPREWALSTLGTLYDLDMLGSDDQSAMATVLWNELDRYGLPKGTGFRRFGFLSLPHPPGVDPVAAFKEYIRSSRFFEPGATRFTIRREHPVCREITGGSQYIEWANDEVCHMVRRLVDWWEADKHKLRTGVGHHYLGTAVEYRRRFTDLVYALAAIVAPPFSADERGETRLQLQHLIEDMASFGMPTLQLQSSMLHMFPERNMQTMGAIKDAMASSKRHVVIDALTALSVVSNRVSNDPSPQQKRELVDLLRVTGELVYWRRDTALSSAMNTMTDIVGRHPWTMVEDTETLVLSGLRRLVSETQLPS